MKKLIIFLSIFFFISLVFADVVSINSGGSENIIINPNAEIEGFFFSFNEGPLMSDPILTSLNGRNESDKNLNCSFLVVDPDDSELNASVKWIKDDTPQFTINYSGIPNNTNYEAFLDSSNLTLGNIWNCSIQIRDNYNSTEWANSNSLEIIDITNPNITIISPNASVNYTTVDVDFNISISENENISTCLYSLDYEPNVTMNRFNDSYFFYKPTLTSGNHLVEFYCNDTSSNWGYNETNFTILDEAAISVLLSDNLTESVKWNVEYLPIDDLDAIGNNLNESTFYYINVSTINTAVDLYVKADGNLFTEYSDELGLGNETYAVSLTDPTVTGEPKTQMTTNYVLIADAIEGDAVVYLKFYLDAPSSQPAGTYTNALSFKAVRDGQAP